MSHLLPDIQPLTWKAKIGLDMAGMTSDSKPTNLQNCFRLPRQRTKVAVQNVNKQNDCESQFSYRHANIISKNVSQNSVLKKHSNRPSLNVGNFETTQYSDMHKLITRLSVSLSLIYINVFSYLTLSYAITQEFLNL